MRDQISLLGIEAIGYHGVYPEERRDGQRFIADLIMYSDLAQAGASDQLADATDYSLIAQRVHSHLIGEPVDLIERLATLIAEDILQNFPKIVEVAVTIHKPDAPVGISIKGISITIHRVR